jgi:uncharacterized membrane protein
VKQTFSQGLLIHIRRTVNSIAFFPALIALLFLVLSYLMIHLDYSAFGKELKAEANWLKLKDASTARTLISVVAGGILSLTVFSFTMVMVVLNQAASQMSNRVIDRLIGNRYQQFILGFYVGTIVYSLFLLSAIRDIDSGIYVPSLSTYLLIVFAVIDIFFFIYFLHDITQSVKYAVIIRRIYRETEKAMKKSCRLVEAPHEAAPLKGEPLISPATGIFEGYDKEAIVRLAKSENFILTFLYPLGSFVLCNTPIALLYFANTVRTKDTVSSLQASLYINNEQTISNNFYYGFRQLTEVAVKALSPGINDPGTAVLSLRSLAELLAFRIVHFPAAEIQDEEGNARVITRELSVEELFNQTFLPIWDYGKNDRFVRNELHHLLLQLTSLHPHPAINKLLLQVNRRAALDNH